MSEQDQGQDRPRGRDARLPIPASRRRCRAVTRRAASIQARRAAVSRKGRDASPARALRNGADGASASACRSRQRRAQRGEASWSVPEFADPPDEQGFELSGPNGLTRSSVKDPPGLRIRGLIDVELADHGSGAPRWPLDHRHQPARAGPSSRHSLGSGQFRRPRALAGRFVRPWLRVGRFHGLDALSTLANRRSRRGPGRDSGGARRSDVAERVVRPRRRSPTLMRPPPPRSVRSRGHRFVERRRAGSTPRDVGLLRSGRIRRQGRTGGSSIRRAAVGTTASAGFG